MRSFFAALPFSLSSTELSLFYVSRVERPEMYLPALFVPGPGADRHRRRAARDDGHGHEERALPERDVRSVRRQDRRVARLVPGVTKDGIAWVMLTAWRDHSS